MKSVFKYYRSAVFALQLFVFILFFLISWNAYHAYFADSEIWAVNLGYHFTEDFQNLWVFTRALFYGLLFVFTRAFPHAEQIFFSARTFMLMSLMVQIFFLGKLALATTRSRFLSWLAVALMLVASFYITQAFRIRSDLFLGTYLLAVAYELNFSEYRLWKKKIVRILCYVLALFITPKGLFYLPILWILDREIKPRYMLAGLAFIPAVIGCMYLFGLMRLGYVSDAALNFTNYFEATLRGGDGGVPYLSAESFLYVRRFISENVVFFSAFALSALLTINLFRHKEEKFIFRVGFCSLYVLCLFFFLPDSLPFFICSLIPFMALGVVVTIKSTFRSVRFKNVQGGLAIFIVGLFAHIVCSNVIFLEKLEANAVTSNWEQIQTITGFRKFLDAYPTITYYDVIGTVPERNTIRHFAGPHQREINRAIGDVIMEKKPDVLLATAKFAYFGTQFSKFMEANYIPVGNGLYIRSFLNTNLKVKKNDLLQNSNKDLVRYNPEFNRFPESQPIYILKSKERVRIAIPPEQISPQEEIVKVSGIPMPTFLPNRNAGQLFKFDIEF